MDGQEPPPSWRELNRDTAPEAEAVLLKLWYETPGWRKLELMDDLNRAARAMALAGLRRRFPEATEAELRRHLADQVLGPELAAAAYPSGS
ncbi:MAG: hypothetical protein DCC51_05770 [Anaerolineae bacterium]|nr:MAG: hypothetical protein DCC51_05770 [Anaerolineae bacterium]